ncbi:hypothetical protein [Ramlibacter sp. AN1133]|uniref:hypothetical protein n=1 Tax=Ramlibacter sp. AN1133 TaxID=3133429 RepID=UPI0030C277CB
MEASDRQQWDAIMLDYLGPREEEEFDAWFQRNKSEFHVAPPLFDVSLPDVKKAVNGFEFAMRMFPAYYWYHGVFFADLRAPKALLMKAFEETLDARIRCLEPAEFPVGRRPWEALAHAPNAEVKVGYLRRALRLVLLERAIREGSHRPMTSEEKFKEVTGGKEHSSDGSERTALSKLRSKAIRTLEAVCTGRFPEPDRLPGGFVYFAREIKEGARPHPWRENPAP